MRSLSPTTTASRNGDDPAVARPAEVDGRDDHACDHGHPGLTKIGDELEPARRERGCVAVAPVRDRAVDARQRVAVADDDRERGEQDPAAEDQDQRDREGEARQLLRVQPRMARDTRLHARPAGGVIAPRDECSGEAGDDGDEQENNEWDVGRNARGDDPPCVGLCQYGNCLRHDQRRPRVAPTRGSWRSTTYRHPSPGRRNRPRAGGAARRPRGALRRTRWACATRSLIFFAALILGIALLAGLSILLGLLVTHVLTTSAGLGGPTTASSRRWPHHRDGTLTSLSSVGSFAGGAPVLPILVGVIAIVCAITRHWRIAAFAVFVLVAESATYRITTLVDPPRPPGRPPAREPAGRRELPVRPHRCLGRRLLRPGLPAHVALHEQRRDARWPGRSRS